MLNEVSCFYMDWNTLGTWVGGIGSATAAWVALTISRAQSNDAKKTTLKNAQVARKICQAEIRRLKDIGLAAFGGQLGLIRQNDQEMTDLNPDEVVNLTRVVKLLQAPMLKANWPLLIALSEKESVGVAEAVSYAERLHDLIDSALHRGSADAGHVRDWTQLGQHLVNAINRTGWIDEEVKAYLRS